MKRIHLACIALFLIITGLWLLADPILFTAADFSALQIPLLNYTGILAIAVMSACMLLAIRSPAINRFLGGLDKAYRLHKWLGIGALIAATCHWLLVKVPDLAFNWPALESPGPQENAVLELFRGQYDLAVQFGDTGFKIFVILVVLALVKRFPYRYFFKTHRLLAILFLFLAFHSIILLEFDYWHELVAPVVVTLIIGGTVAAGISISRRIGKRRSVVGVIDELVYLEESDTLRVVVEFKEQWPGHEAGQFAFVTFDSKEGPHPFTISSPWKNNGRIFFLIKGLGDYTTGLRDRLQTRDYVEVEGPYGQFNFTSDKARQIWVAGGIGIAPFVARTKRLADEADEVRPPVDLFYTANEIDELMLSRISTNAESAGVNLHVIIPARDGHLDFDHIRELVPEWSSSDIWFCGPASFGVQLKKDAVAAGLSDADFHQELFEMR